MFGDVWIGCYSLKNRTGMGGMGNKVIAGNERLGESYGQGYLQVRVLSVEDIEV